MTTVPFRTPAPTEWSTPWQVLADSTRTGGQLVVGEARLPPHTSGPSLHVHTREDESAYVVEGTLTVAVGEEMFEATPGEFVWLPRNVPHTFANRSSTPVRVVGAIVPGGLEGMFAEQAEYFASLTGPPDEAAIAEIGARYGVTVVGPALDAGAP
jgi:mannose-6-phosphate isomerase-like protein (cupin superfamily)